MACAKHCQTKFFFSEQPWKPPHNRFQQNSRVTVKAPNIEAKKLMPKPWKLPARQGQLRCRTPSLPDWLESHCSWQFYTCKNCGPILFLLRVTWPTLFSGKILGQKKIIREESISYQMPTSKRMWCWLLDGFRGTTYDKLQKLPINGCPMNDGFQNGPTCTKAQCS